MDQVVYLDHAATTPVRPEVVEAMLPFFSERWGNPSALYGPARAARQALEEARAAIAAVLRCEPAEVIFTASGSDGINLAIKGVALALRSRGNHLVTSKVEHHAVLHSCEWLRRYFGFEVTYVDVDRHGLVDLDQLERALTDRTILVSVMYANNEVGTIQPIAEVARLARARGVLVHTDAVQAAGSLPLDVNALGVDLLSLAGHKFYAPKGIGALYARRGVPLAPLTSGGSQERNRRAGTENVPYAVGMATALRLAQATREAENARQAALRDRLLEALPALVPDTRVTGHPIRRLPNHASFVFGDVEIHSVLLGLDRLGYCASSGSACTSASTEPSHVLRAMQVPRRYLFGALRLTLGLSSTEQHVEGVLHALPPLVAQARAASAAGLAGVGAP